MVRLLSAVSLVIGVAVCNTAVATEGGVLAGFQVGEDLRRVAGGWYAHLPGDRDDDSQTIRVRLTLTDINAEVLRGVDGLVINLAPGGDESLAKIAGYDVNLGEPYRHDATFPKRSAGGGGYEGGFDAGFTASGEFVDHGSGAQILGSRFSNVFRIGFQGFYSRHYVHGFPTDVGNFSYTRRTSIAGGMLNVDYDLRIGNLLSSHLGDEWSPYIGGGIGIANVSVKASKPRRNLIDGDVKVLVYQARAGIAYKVTRYLSASLEYRFFDTERAYFSTVDGGAFEPDYQSHTVEAVMHLEF